MTHVCVVGCAGRARDWARGDQVGLCGGALRGGAAGARELESGLLGWLARTRTRPHQELLLIFVLPKGEKILNGFSIFMRQNNLSRLGPRMVFSVHRGETCSIMR